MLLQSDPPQEKRGWVTVFLATNMPPGRGLNRESIFFNAQEGMICCKKTAPKKQYGLQLFFSDQLQESFDT